MLGQREVGGKKQQNKANQLTRVKQRAICESPGLHRTLQ